MIERKVVKAIPSSFVASNMKLATESGSGEAKLWVGQISNSAELDSFFEFNSVYSYRFTKENLLEYMQQVKIEYIYQKFNNYKNASLLTWNENYSQIKDLSISDFEIQLEKFTDKTRYYVRADQLIFKKIFRKIAVPKLTNMVFVKNDENKEITLLLELNLEYENLANNLNPFTPEWFREKAKDYPKLDAEATEILNAFREEFSTKRLMALSGIELLHTIFLNNENANNLCRILEFDANIREMFGSIKGGSAYKYGLYYSTDGKWMAGTNRNPKELSEEEAIELGTKIRDCLVAGADIIRNYDTLETLEDYKKLYSELNQATEGHISRAWFMKYYFMLFTEQFASDYSDVAQRTVLSAIGQEPEKYAIVRMGQIKIYTDECGISNVMFNKVFWDNYSDDADVVVEEESPLEIKYETNCDDKGFPRNRILFGAPGTGKSYTLNSDRKVLLYGDKNADEETLDLSQFGGYERVTFHPDYSYANFVGTYKPVPKDEDAISYEFVPGPFMRVYVDALKSGRTEEAKPYLLIVEEINRANVAAVFGDVFQLLDRDKNVSEYPIMPSRDVKEYLAREDVLGGNPEDYKFIRIPNNMFIWATMNSADQGVFPMDTAFKRRWDFTYLGIDDAVETMSDEIKGKRYTLGTGTNARFVTWNELRTYINSVLSSEDYNINEDKLLGPYFISRSILESATDDEFIKIFKNKVIMYLFDDAVKQKKKTFFEKCKDDIKGVRYSDICKQFDEKGVFIFPGKVAEVFTIKSDSQGMEVATE